MLNAESNTDLVLAAFLDNEGSLLSSLNLGLGGELKSLGLIVILEDNGELRDHDTARVILRGDVVRINT